MSILLVGQQGLSWGYAGGNLSNNGGACYFTAGYTAVASGTALNAHVRIGAGSSAATCKVVVYSGTGTGAPILATSNNISVVANQDCFAPINCTITNGNAYTLVLSSAAGFTTNVTLAGGGQFVCHQNTSANFSNSSPPPTLPAQDASTGAEFIIWLDAALYPNGTPTNWFGA